ncbi:MAG: 4-carboxymuconolactone decarboxylase, partial [Nocardioides sp.]
GTSALLDATPGRWFADPGLTSPARAALLGALGSIDDESYAAACEALAAHDVRDRLDEIGAPVLALAGAGDSVTTPDSLRHVAQGVQNGRLAVLSGAAHLPPVEKPEETADLLRGHLESVPTTRRDPRVEGMRVRRQVLGDAHVDRASASVTDLTEEFQELITRYAWGEIWTRPGLDRRSRSMITMTALIALGHDEELAMHVRAARTNGLSVDEIKEVILQSAIYCGVPAANTAFRIAQRVLEEGS